MRIGSAEIILLLLLLSPVLVYLIIYIWYRAAKNMAKIAEDKGYTEKKWFHYCFWLGLVGFLMVCAMPDRQHSTAKNAEQTAQTTGFSTGDMKMLNNKLFPGR